MFISKDYPGTMMSLLYNAIGILFTPFMIILQAETPLFLPTKNYSMKTVILQ